MHLLFCYLVGLDGALSYNNFLRPEMSKHVTMGMHTKKMKIGLMLTFFTPKLKH